MRLGPRVTALLRAVAALFFGATALYGLLAFSPFAYHQFIRPHFVTWLVWSVTFYDALFLGVFSLTLLTLLSDVERPRTRALALAYIACWGLVALALFIRPVLESLGSNNWSLAVTALALIPPLWLATIDHLVCWRSVFPADADTSERAPEARLFAAGVAAALYLWIVYVAVALFRKSAAIGGTDLSWLAVGRSLLQHLTVFTALTWLFIVVVSLARFGRRRRQVEYVLMLSILAGWFFLFTRRLVLPSLAITGGLATMLAAGFGVFIAATWSGIALRLAAAYPPSGSGLDVFVGPARPSRSPRWLAAWLAVLPVFAALAVFTSEHMDWSFLLQKSGVLAIWLLAWAAFVTLARGAERPSRTIVLVLSLIVLACYHGARTVERALTGQDRARQIAAFDRYAALDASFRTLDDTLADRPTTLPEFYEYLEANSNVRSAIPISPVSLDVPPHAMSAGKRLPHIFLFVVDSLRPDYVAAYNPAATFSSNLGAFARESLVFQNAFSRYGGTGLSVPSIWSGSLLPHRQYVMPFTPMNTLLKLLKASGYRVTASLDSIMVQLLPREPGFVELGAESWTARDDACHVFLDLQHVLDTAPHDGSPVFAYSLPQNTHLSYVQGHPMVDKEYPGFYSPLAARVHQVDTCFGGFIAYLKAHGLYDDSIVIVTSDHGDSVGEGGRWGHGYAGFPEVFRIPLIVHVPARLAEGWSADLTAVSFLTDLVPTLDVLLHGEAPALRGRGLMFGAPLFHPSTVEASSERRRGAFLLAASYGPVYAMLQQNGERLYIIDGVNSRDYAYNLTGSLTGTPVALTTAERVANQRLIREQIADIAAFFHFDTQPSQ